MEVDSAVSRARAAEVFANVPDDEVAKMVEHNTRRWYNFPEAGFKAHNADEGNPWRPNDGEGPEPAYVGSGDHGGIGDVQKNLGDLFTAK